jgi:hypothetical protein
MVNLDSGKAKAIPWEEVGREILRSSRVAQ